MRRFVFWSLLLSGCSSSSMVGDEKAGAGNFAEDAADSAWDTATDDALEPDEENAENSVAPAWFALDAEIQVLDGLTQSIGFTVRVYGDVPSDGELAGCSVSANVDLFASEATTPDPSITNWWSLNSITFLEDWSCGEAEQLPILGAIGLGEFHPELRSRVLPLEISEPATFLYGFYASLSFDSSLSGFDSGNPYILGYGSSESTLSQLEEVSLDGVLPDGVYQLVGVFLLPILQ